MANLTDKLQDLNVVELNRIKCEIKLGLMSETEHILVHT